MYNYFQNGIDIAVATGNIDRAADYLHTARAVLDEDDFEALTEYAASEYNLIW